MSRLSWGSPGARVYYAGVDRGVLFTGGVGVPWIGLTAVREAPAFGVPTPYYVDGRKYLNEAVPEEYAANLEAFTYPDEFELCDGTASNGEGLYIDEQQRYPFDLTYRTRVGNDLEGVDFGYRLHLIYNAMASPTTKDHVTLGSETDPMGLNWALTTLPEDMAGYEPVSHLMLDSRRTDPQLLVQIENLLYGTAATEPTMPRPNDLLKLFKDRGDIDVEPTGYGQGLYGRGYYGGRPTN